MCALVRVMALKPASLVLMLRFFVSSKLLGVDARLQALRALGATVGDEVYIGARVRVRRPSNLTVGDGSSLSGRVVIDSWRPVVIGKDVLVNGDLTLLTAGHDVDSPTFRGVAEGVTIGDHAWLPLHIIVLPGAHIGTCAVVGTGSVVTKPVPPYAIVAGNPAKQIGERARHDYTYRASTIV
jgi:acetyltransferase-like isoleucine patch superfamily enzyme